MSNIDWSVVLIRFWTLVVPYVAYFLGIIVRKYALPGRHSPPLSHQLLLGVPLSLVIVSALLQAYDLSTKFTLPAYLFTIGIIIEHGMVANETLAVQLKKIIG